jgi:hypothetical protein
VAGAPSPRRGRRLIAADRVSAVFGIELDEAPAARPGAGGRKRAK